MENATLFCFWMFVCVTLFDGVTRAQEDFGECEGVEEGSFVSSWTSCQMYVYCAGEDSATGECDDGQYFDGESGACDAAENVECRLDEGEQLPGDGEAVEEEPEPEVVTTTTAAPNTGTTTMEIITVEPVVQANCPNSDDPNQVILIPNIESCANYFLCYHGHAMEMHCTNQLHFNAHTGQCDFPEKAQCAIERPNANRCLPHMTDFFPHPAKCNYFYYCIKGYLTVQQCPFYYGWDIERRSCVILTQAKCYGGARRL